MFKDTKYTKAYYFIINRAKKLNRSKKKDYFELHHIIPRCSPFCGSDEEDNLVLLTAKEHFICHMLLTKMCDGEGKYKMVCALNNMSRISENQNRIITAAQYDYVKRQLSKEKTGTKHSKETLEKFKNREPWNKGKTRYTDDRLKRFSENISGDNHHRPMLGKRVSLQTKNKMSLSQTGSNNSFYGKKHKNETKTKMSDSRIGKTHSEETREKISAAQKLKNNGAESLRGSKWITNGEETFLLKNGESMPNGFTYGRTIKKRAND